MKRMVANLRKVTPNLLGGIFNAVDVKSAGAYYATTTPHTTIPRRSASPGVRGRDRRKNAGSTA